MRSRGSRRRRGVQLSNWWQVNALLLACMRVGAVWAPIMTSIQARELEQILAHVRARLIVTVDEWDGFALSAALAEILPGSARRTPRRLSYR